MLTPETREPPARAQHQGPVDTAQKSPQLWREGDGSPALGGMPGVPDRPLQPGQPRAPFFGTMCKFLTLHGCKGALRDEP